MTVANARLMQHTDLCVWFCLCGLTCRYIDCRLVVQVDSGSRWDHRSIVVHARDLGPNLEYGQAVMRKTARPSIASFKLSFPVGNLEMESNS